MIPDTWLLSLGRHWRMFVYVLNICRFSLIVLIAGALLLNVGQGEDLLVATAEDGRYVLLLGSCLLWAFSIWLWTRTLLDIDFPSTPRDWTLLAKYRRWTPRVLGVLPFIIVAASSYAIGEPATAFVLPSLGVGALFAILVVFRRKIGRAGANMTTRARPEQSLLWVGELEAQAPALTSVWNAGARALGRAALLLLVLGVILFVWGLIDPLSMGRYFNALVLLMVWGATFLPIGSLITYWANKSRLPLLSMLLLLALIFSLWNDNHEIRALQAASPTERVPAAAALDAWAEKHCKGRECGPLVIVAAAGGGIRAAYWTAVVLGHLDDTVDRFRNRLFAVSGVSGGSVGATVYRGIDPASNGACRGKLLQCGTQVLSKDYLAPLSASLLYRELVQRFLPIALLPDRATTLEIAWEQGFRSVTQASTFADSFSALGADKQTAWPALFLNATWSNNGRRIVAASVDIEGDPNFAIANDQLEKIGYDIRLSTAAHNSARFPYVSPPGSWRDRGDGKREDAIQGRLQDGGLFENYGAETALEILALAQQRLKGKRYTPVVIMITSDPSLPSDLAASPNGRAGNLGYETLTTFRTIANTRVGHGAEAASRLKNWAERHGKFAYFRMCDAVRKHDDPPLGWALSHRAQRTIQGYLLENFVPGGETLAAPTCRKENLDNAEAVRKLLS